jgi:hypothetical protein
MKFPQMTIAVLFLTTSAFANVIDSQYEESFNKLIANKISNKCGSMKELTLISVIETEDEVDQGITDVYYSLKLTGEQLYDQNIYDVYNISIEASYTDGYDRSTGESGSYSIESINCIMQ